MSLDFFKLSTGELVQVSEVAAVHIDRIGRKNGIITLKNRQAFNISTEDYDAFCAAVNIVTENKKPDVRQEYYDEYVKRKRQAN